MVGGVADADETELADVDPEEVERLGGIGTAVLLGGVGAGPVYRLLGKKDLGTAEMPPVGTALMDGELAWRMHSGGHTTGPNIDTFVAWASRYIKAPAAKPSGAPGER